MSKKDMLFDLIKSLNNNEKRYFTLFASRHTIGEKNNYLKLFEAVSKQKIYDEKELIKYLPNGVKLTKYKQYLYKLVLKSLHFFYADSTVDAEIKKGLHYVEILYNKGLFEQCKNILEKLSVLATEHEKFLSLLEIKEWQHQLIRIQRDNESLKKYVKEGYEEEEIIRNKHRNIRQYKKIGDQVINLNSRDGGYVRDKKMIARYSNIVKDPLLSDEEMATSYTSKKTFYSLRAHYYSAVKDKNNFYKSCESLIELFEKNPQQKNLDQKMYVSSLLNFMLAASTNKKYNETFMAIKELRQLMPSLTSTKEQTSIYIQTYNHELNIYIATAQFENALKLIMEMQSKPLDEILDSYSKTIVYYNFSYVCFLTGDNNNALKWINRIINFTDQDQRQDIQCFARILNLFLHYELENNDLLEYAVKTTYRFLDKRKHLYKLEASVLNFIKKDLIKLNKKKELMIPAFKKLRTELEEITKDSYEKEALNYFDLVSWLTGKIENRPFAEIIKEKVKNHSYLLA